MQGIASFLRAARSALTYVGARTRQVVGRKPSIILGTPQRGAIYTVTERSKIGSVIAHCATLEEALEVANERIARSAPGTRITLKNNVTGTVYGENGIRALRSE